ncbi:MAG: tetratricopeptide repeat protein [Myxococcota bacterium]
MSATASGAAWARWGIHGIAWLTGAAVLVAAGQPIFTDDLWWHLGLGQAFASEGPHLAEDPLLDSPAGPPHTAAWLADAGFARLLELTGFQGLRALHVALVLAASGMLWGLLRRAAGSAAAASGGVVIFWLLSTYRLVQLRPHLFTLLAAFAVVALLIVPRKAPGPGRVLAAVAIVGLWAQLHAAFLLGPLLVAAALGGVLCAHWLSERARSEGWTRAVALAVALVGMLAAGLANPSGADAYLAYFAAGGETTDLGVVLDEWSPVSLFAFPTTGVPPTPLAWTLVWALLIATLAVVVRLLRRLDRISGQEGALASSAALSGALLLFASRFLWLGSLIVLWLVRAERPALRALLRRSAGGLAIAGTLLLLVAAFFQRGDWPLVTRGLPQTWSGYATPYALQKYATHALWWLADTELEGHLYTDYFQGGFAGYWLAPQLKTLINGSLNMPKETVTALAAIDARQGAEPGDSFPALLDRLQIDVFLGIRLPETGNPHRPWAYTAGHLEGTPGWRLVFRNLQSAVYLRNVPRNAENFARVARYYASRGIPFDRERGLVVSQLLANAPEWSVAHGVVPRAFQPLRGSNRLADRQRTAALYTTLGAYREALAIDEPLLRAHPDRLGIRRRLAWTLLRMERPQDALRVLDAAPPEQERDRLLRGLTETARAFAILETSEARRSALARTPFLVRAEVPWLTQGIVPPRVRPAR